PRQRLLHVHPDPQELGRVYRADLPITADLNAFALAAAALEPPTEAQRGVWQDWTRAARQDYLDTLTPEPMAGGVNLGEIVRHVDTVLPADAIVSNGAGNYTLWVQRFRQYAGIRTQLTPTSGTMGYGLPAAIAA